MKFTIYSKEGCSFCVRAKELLESLGLEYVEMPLADHPELQSMLRESGFTTVPQIFCQETYIGGYTDLELYLLDHI